MSRPAHAPRVPFAALLALIVLGGFLLLLALNTASAANELRRRELATKDAGISAGLEQASNEVAASAAPNALASAAAALGMVPGGNPAFITIGADGTVKIIGSPAAATPIQLPPIVVAASSTNHVPSSSASSSTKTRASNTAAKRSPSPKPSTTTRSSPAAASTKPAATPSTATSTLPGGPR